MEAASYQRSYQRPNCYSCMSMQHRNNHRIVSIVNIVAIGKVALHSS